MEETVEQIEARLKAAHAQWKREDVRNGTDADYAAHKAGMLKTAAQVHRGKQQPIPDVHNASDSDYEAAKRLMLRQSYRR